MTTMNEFDYPAINDCEPEIEAQDLRNEALEAAMQAHQERLEYHLRGAWRAGYDYLHVYNPTLGAGDPEIRTAVLPSNRHDFPYTPEGYRHSRTYDLEAVGKIIQEDIQPDLRW